MFGKKTQREIENLKSQCQWNEERTGRCLAYISSLQNELDLLSQALGYNRVAYQAKVVYEKKGGPERP